MSGGDVDGDDDDFQNPSDAVAFSQSIILSSLKNRRTKLPTLSNARRSRKRRRASAAIGKENVSMPEKQCPFSRVFSDGVEKVLVTSERKGLYHEVSPVGLCNRSVAVVCSEEIGIEDTKCSLLVPDELKFGEDWTYFETITGNVSQSFVSAEASLMKSVVCNPSNSDRDCSDVSTDNFESGNKARNSCYLEKPMAVCVTESANESNEYNESHSRGTSLASTELGLPENCPKRKILNSFVDQGMIEDKGEICFGSRLLELEEKSVHRNYSPTSDSYNDLNLSREESNVLEKGPFEGIQCSSIRGRDVDNILVDKKKQKCYSRSIEAKLLNPTEKLIPSVEVGVCDECEPGTQLNMLMDICGEINDQDCSSGGMTSFEGINLGMELTALEKNLLVECPLCRSDITKLSEEMRQIHTNECLDNDMTNEVSVPIGQVKLNACQQLVDNNPVLEWLRALDLCRYEEVFTREEIDWDTLQWLTEEDLINIGVVALGPRKKIVHALKELRERNSLVPDGESGTSNVAANEKKNIALPGNKLITEYFQGPVAYRVRGSIPVKLFHNVEKASKDPIQKRFGGRRDTNRGRRRDIPPWCCVSGTSFRVDAFRYLSGDCSHWFLTHFHMDHYQGLTKNFCHGTIYCSKITAHLVNMKIGVPWDKIQILPLNEKIIIAGVNLTCLDANHCPGSIIILFDPPNNKAILHTGDFRFSAEMAESPLLKSSHIDTLILDTTYCNPQYDFPKQDEVIQFVIDAIQAEAFNPRTLFLIGTYTIGKERLFLETARALKRKVYVGAGKLNLLKCLNLPEEDMRLLTENETESHIHVVPMWTIASFKRMKHISKQYMGHYNLIVAFSPTGWTFGKGKKKTPGRRWQQGTVIRYEVPYSEHCSFTELKDFVRFISPENIIPSVNNEGPESVDAMLALLLSDS